MELKEITKETAEELYLRYDVEIMVGNSEDSFYRFRRSERECMTIDDCIYRWLNYHDGPVRFFIKRYI